MQKNLTNAAKRALESATDEARLLGTSYVGTEHLLLGLLLEEGSVAANVLKMHDITYTDTRSMISALSGGTGDGFAEMTPGLRRIISDAAESAARRQNSRVGTEDLLLSMLYDRECVAVKLILSQNASISEIQNDLMSFFGDISSPGDRQKPKKETPPGVSLQYGRDLTAAARMGALDPLIGRKKEVERVIAVLSRRRKNNPCLIGEPGVGKTAVVEGLCERIVSENVPETLIGKSVIMMDIGAMISGAKYRGEFEERLKKVMDEVIKSRNVILFIDEIHTIVGAGAAEGAVDAANILKPYLARGEIQVIGATTTREYRLRIEKDPALERRFQPISVDEPSVEESVRILEGLREKYELHHGVTIEDGAIRAAVTLSKRYIPDRFLPDKAIDLIDEAAASKRMETYTVPDEIKQKERMSAELIAKKEQAIKMQNFEAAARLRDEAIRAERDAEKMREEWRRETGGRRLFITEDDVARMVTQSTDVPVGKIGNDERAALSSFEDNIKRELFGQNDAVDICARAIRRARAGFAGRSRPVCSLLFVGGTGVGKTELARLIAKELFGSRDEMLRIDMSEYMERHSVSRLIGSPPGYVGYGEGGKLTEGIRRRPYSVVLFDEVEKAHPDVLNLLLQILDDGMLTDSEGRRADFRSAVIIMTSNAGSTEKTNKSGFITSPDAERERVISSLKEYFRPEFLGRIDEVVYFHPLGEKELEGITSLMLQRTACAAAADGIELSFDPSVASLIVKKSDIRSLGARPLRRTVQTLVEDELSTLIIKGNVKSGGRIFCRTDGDKLKFDVYNPGFVNPN